MYRRPRVVPICAIVSSVEGPPRWPQDMADSEYVRAQATRMFALSVKTRDVELSQKLALKAAEYLDQAMELERG